MTRSSDTPAPRPSPLREKAEAALKKKVAKRITRLTETEALKLIHELEVHQIELELQNEELILAREVAETSSDKYTDLYDFSPTAYFTLSREGKIIDLNLTGSLMLGKERSLVKNTLFKPYLSAESRPVFSDLLNEVFKNKEKASCDISLTDKDKNLKHLQLTAIPAENPDNCLVTALDITERKANIDALHKSEERLSAIVTNTPDHVIIQDNNLKYTFVLNPQLGFTQKDMIGKTDMDFLEKDDAINLSRIKKEVMKTGKSIELQVPLYNKKGEVEFFQGSYIPKFDKTGKVDGLIGYFQNVTKYKLAEETLRKSEEKFRQITTMSPAGIYLTDKDGLCTYTNLKWQEMAGFCQTEAMGNGWINGIHPEDREKVRHDWNRMIKSNGTWSCQYRFINKEGKITWVHGLALAQKNASDETTGYTGLNIDITEIKKIQELLMDKEERLSMAQKVAHLGSWKWHIQENRLEWSDEMYNIFGISKDEFTGNLSEVIEKAIHPEDRTAVENSNLSVSSRGVTVPLEYRIIKPDGSIRHVWAEAGELIKDVNNTPVSLSGIVLDITDRKMADIRISESEEMNRVILQTAMDGFWLIDNSGQIEKVNDTLCKITGYSRKELLSMHISDIDALESASDAAKHMNKIIKEGYDRFETLLQRKDKTLIDVEVSAQYKPELGNKILAFFHDISDRKKAENEILENQKKLKKKIDQLERFNNLVVDRELKMMELKKEINELSQRLGEEARYKIVK